MRPSMLLVLMALTLAVTFVLAKSTDSEDSSADEEMKAVRRTEISRALALLKKHSVVGKNAKIVLKTSGRHLLVDPSGRLQVVTSHSSDSLKTNSLSAKASKLSKTKVAPKATPKKRASGSSRSNKASPTPSPLTISKSASVTNPALSSLQRKIMDAAATSTPTLIDSLMGATQLAEITRLLSAIVRNRQAKSIGQLSDLITETLDDRFGPHWHTVSVATASSGATHESAGPNELLIHSSSNKEDLTTLTHVAIDDHRKTATFYATYDFGRTLRIYVFK